MELDGTGVFDLDDMPAELRVHGLGGHLTFFQAIDGLGAFRHMVRRAVTAQFAAVLAAGRTYRIFPCRIGNREFFDFDLCCYVIGGFLLIEQYIVNLFIFGTWLCMIRMCEL